MEAAKNPEIRNAVNTLYELSADEKVRAEYEMRQKAWRDRVSLKGCKEMCLRYLIPLNPVYLLG
jgi:hypothetical protein